VLCVEIDAEGVGLQRRQAPTPGLDEALVQVIACGVCGTDLSYARGMALPRGVAYPIRPGHEVIGSVVCSPDTALRAGQRVVLHPLAPCGDCADCQGEAENLCPRTRILGVDAPGGLAEYVVWPTRRMVALPEGPYDLVSAAILGDAVATACHAARLAAPAVRDSLVVLGAGGLGTQVLTVARHLYPGLRCVGIVRSEASARRLEHAGFPALVGGNEVAQRLVARFGRPDAVIDFSGSPDAPGQAVDMVRRGGVVILGTLNPAAFTLPSMSWIMTREITIRGCFASTIADLRSAVALAVPLADSLKESVTHTVPLDEVQEAFDLLARRPPGFVRVVAVV
jgi:2-desacetyl-2-hydroxyethyl bacteriochlorophyllide A dehydrogenase